MRRVSRPTGRAAACRGGLGSLAARLGSPRGASRGRGGARRRAERRGLGFCFFSVAVRAGMEGKGQARGPKRATATARPLAATASGSRRARPSPTCALRKGVQHRHIFVSCPNSGRCASSKAAWTCAFQRAWLPARPGAARRCERSRRAPGCRRPEPRSRAGPKSCALPARGAVARGRGLVSAAVVPAPPPAADGRRAPGPGATYPAHVV